MRNGDGLLTTALHTTEETVSVLRLVLLVLVDVRVRRHFLVADDFVTCNGVP